MKRPWRVDNTAKAILDDVASRLKADPNAKIVIVGYADGERRRWSDPARTVMRWIWLDSVR